MEHRNFVGRTPLLLATISGHVGVVEILAKLGADVNTTDASIWYKNSRRSPLHWACHRGLQEIAAKLCDLGANIEAKDGLGRTPIFWAVRKGNLECLQVRSRSRSRSRRRGRRRRRMGT